MTEEEITDLKTLVKEAINEEVHEFWVERETHYKHHEFIESWIKWTDRVSNAAVQTLIKSVIIFFLGLLAIGFAIFGFKK